MSMGITIDRWGPAAWNTLHAFAHSVPLTLDATQQSDFVQFLYLFGAHLPCPKCRAHFKEYLDTHIEASDFTTRKSIIAFVHEAHNDVNVRLGKRTWTLHDHMEVYELPVARRSFLTTKVAEHDVLALVLLAVVGVVLGIRVWHRRFGKHNTNNDDTSPSGVARSSIS